MLKSSGTEQLLIERDCFRADGCSADYLVLLARTVCRRVPVGSGVVTEREYDLEAYRMM